LLAREGRSRIHNLFPHGNSILSQVASRSTQQAIFQSPWNFLFRIPSVAPLGGAEQKPEAILSTAAEMYFCSAYRAWNFVQFRG
jgi:hypothetical protein